MSTSVLTVDINEPAGEVLRLLAEYPVHHLPVLDRQKVVGMLSTADLMKVELFLPKGSKSPIEYLNQRMKVGAMLRRPLLAIPAHQSVESAAQLMAKHGVHALPVVDPQDQLLGLITTTDIIYAALRPAHAVAERDPSGSAADQPHLISLSAAQLELALRAAERAAGSAQDADSVCQALLYLRAKVTMLEHVRLAAERYLSAGQDEQLHMTLAKALSAASRGEQHGYHASIPRR
ncbi:MAG: HPP family protein [Steroidobacteraceae bacterium]